MANSLYEIIYTVVLSEQFFFKAGINVMEMNQDNWIINENIFICDCYSLTRMSLENELLPTF